MKKFVNPFDYAGQICQAMKKGILLTTKNADTVNTMTIGWGAIGVEWNLPVFIGYVRLSRHTRQMLDINGEFTVNIPLESADPQILKICGTRSGRDMDKIRQLGLTLEEPVDISVPGIRELPLTLECKVIYRQEQDPAAMPAPILDRFYPEEEETLHPGSSRDVHVCYYGQILNAYIIIG